LIEHRMPAVRHGDGDPPTIGFVPDAGNETSSLETIHDPRHRRVAYVDTAGEHADRGFAKASQLFEGDQLRPGNAESLEQLAGVQVDRPHGTP
jgi:hypothetical protein